MADVKLDLESLADALDALATVSSVEAAVGVGDPDAARYVRILEYGSISGRQPWPHPGARTVLAVNPETGQTIVASAQAPQGFIRTNLPAMARALLTEMEDLVFDFRAESLQQSLEASVRNAASDAAELLRAAVPKDTGAVAQHLQVFHGK